MQRDYVRYPDKPELTGDELFDRVNKERARQASTR